MPEILEITRQGLFAVTLYAAALFFALLEVRSVRIAATMLLMVIMTNRKANACGSKSMRWMRLIYSEAGTFYLFEVRK